MHELGKSRKWVLSNVYVRSVCRQDDVALFGTDNPPSVHVLSLPSLKWKSSIQITRGFGVRDLWSHQDLLLVSRVSAAPVMYCCGQEMKWPSVDRMWSQGNNPDWRFGAITSRSVIFTNRFQVTLLSHDGELQSKWNWPLPLPEPPEPLAVTTAGEDFLYASSPSPGSLRDESSLVQLFSLDGTLRWTSYFQERFRSFSKSPRSDSQLHAADDETIFAFS